MLLRQRNRCHWVPTQVSRRDHESICPPSAIEDRSCFCRSSVTGTWGRYPFVGVEEYVSGALTDGFGLEKVRDVSKAGSSV